MKEKEHIKMAKVKFRFVLDYETTLAENVDDVEDIAEVIAREKEYLEDYKEDLYSALDDSKLISVQILETKHYTVPHNSGNNYII